MKRGPNPLAGAIFSIRLRMEDFLTPIISSMSVHQKGSGNSQYGTMWITNGLKNKKISKDELDKYTNLGY